MEQIKLLFIGAVIGFLFSVLKDYFVENNKKKIKQKEFKREKLEEVFMLMNKIQSETLKPLQTKKSISEEGARLAMIIRFYFPNLKEDFNVFLITFTDTNMKTIKIKEIDQNDEYVTKFFYEYSEFLNKIVLESKKYV